MFKRFFLSVVLIFLCSFSLFSQTRGQSLGFFMRNFFVTVDQSNLKKNGRHFNRRPSENQRISLEDHLAVYSGTGFIIIHGVKVPVNFSNIKVSKSSQRDIVRAISGIVSGKTLLLGRRFINYSIDHFNIQMKIPSIRITNNSAIATVHITLDAPTFYTRTMNSLDLTSTLCRINPTGAIEGNDFEGSSVFNLKDSVYRLELKQQDHQFVRLGSFPLTKRITPGETINIMQKPLVRLKGFAYGHDVKLFSFSSTILLDRKQAEFSLSLLDSIERTPELGYSLSLLSGKVEYKYNLNGIQLCDGSFKANLQLPDAIRNVDDTNIKLENIILKTDETGRLFNTISIEEKIKTGYPNDAQEDDNIFLIEPKKESVLVNFPNWHKEIPYSSYNIKEDDPCEDLFQLLESSNPTERPGLSIIRGILYFKSPQATFRLEAPTNPFNLKTQFWGTLTCTPWGITGELTSSGSSFVPSNVNIEECSQAVDTRQYTLLEIIDFENNLPPEPKEKFSLAGFRILDMHANSIRICKHKLDSSSFRYTIHFPYPSFIDLEFEDTTLDLLGKFNSAHGPIASVSYEFDEQPHPAEMEELLEVLPKYTTVTYNIVSKIFFAWRLPVAFTHHGVTIEYSDSPLYSEAKVSMEPFNPSNYEIASSELKILPLYSRHSDVKFGVRFQGKFSTDGKFTLTDWDREPVFSKIYPQPENEKAVGFFTKELDIGLSNWEESNPVTRDFDFKWDGEIQFPFFSWQGSAFTIKNLITKKQLPLSLSGVGINDCNGDSLKIKITKLMYSYENLIPFTSTGEYIDVYKTLNGNWEAHDAKLLNLSSYLNGFVILENTPELIIIKDPTIILKHAIRSDNIINLVCYDQEALYTRQSYGIAESCCGEYYIGTCIAKTPEGKEIMYAPNTKWYPGNNFLGLIGSDTKLLSSDSGVLEYDTVINIPGAQLAFTDDGIITGAFGATYTPVANEIPYEGEFRFYLDPNQGHYYVQMAGSFTYFLRFSGELFIVHAPYGRLKDLPPFFGVTNILDDFSSRALFPDVNEFTSTVRLDNLSNNAIITGFFTAGNAKKGFNLGLLSVEIASGPGIYAYKYKTDNDSGLYYGTFLNTKARADILILNLRAYNKLACGILHREEFFADGTFRMSAGANGYFIYCEAGVEGNLEFSSKSGFDFSDCSAWAGCD